MSEIQVFTTAYYEDPGRWRLLRESALACHVELCSYGHSGAYPGLIKAKIVDMLGFLEKQKSEFILYTDSGDSIFAYWDPDQALDVLKMSGDKAIFCAERNCHPYAHLAELYPKAYTPWKYLNAGGFLGRREYIMSCLRYGRMLWDLAAEGHKENDDQAIWTKEFLSDKDFALDYQCQIFQSLFLNYPTDVIVEDGKARNTVTGSFPMILHANGGQTGLDGFYSRIYEPERLDPDPLSTAKV